MDPMVEAERGQRVALRHARERDQALRLRMPAEEVEVETGGDVGLARSVEQVLHRSVRAVPVGLAARLAYAAVVDQERIARVGEPGPTSSMNAVAPSGRTTSAPSASRRSSPGGGSPRCSTNRSPPGRPGSPSSRSGSEQPPERQVVQQLVRDDQLRGSIEGRRPRRRRRPRAQPRPRARIDRRVRHPDPRSARRAAVRACRRRRRPRTAAGTGLAEPVAEVDDRPPEQLREDGVDVRAGHEMAVGADRGRSKNPPGPYNASVMYSANVIGP